MVHWFYYVGRLMIRILLALLTRWQVNGKENVPKTGPLLVVANHVNAVDPPLLGVSLGRKMMFMAKEELFHSRFTGYFIRGFGSFPVRRGRLDLKCLRQADQILAQGLAVTMFPEGKRSRNGQIQPALPGSALIAARSRVPVLPVGIIGTRQLRGTTWLLRRPRITVNIGPPFSLPPVDGRLTKAKLAEHSDLIMERIAELLPEDYQGGYRA